MAKSYDAGDELHRLGGVVKRNRSQFIESEFSLAFTFCDLAETEYKVGNRDHADNLVRRASEAAETAYEYLRDTDLPPKQAEEMRQQLDELRARLKELQSEAA